MKLSQLIREGSEGCTQNRSGMLGDGDFVCVIGAVYRAIYGPDWHNIIYSGQQKSINDTGDGFDKGVDSLVTGGQIPEWFLSQRRSPTIWNILTYGNDYAGQSFSQLASWLESIGG